VKVFLRFHIRCALSLACLAATVIRAKMSAIGKPDRIASRFTAAVISFSPLFFERVMAHEFRRRQNAILP
jgi:hypothetical protein